MNRHRIINPFRLFALAGFAALSCAAGPAAADAAAGERHPEFPISVAQARDRAEARFQSMDTDRSGEISPAEFAAAPRPDHWPRHGMHGARFHHGDRGPGDRGPGDRGPGDRSPGDRPEAFGGGREALDAELFERLDEDGDGMLSKAEFAPDKLRNARHEAMQARLFSHLDADGSGGLSRDELPDPSRHLEAMDSDHDGTVTREEAREYRQQQGGKRG